MDDSGKKRMETLEVIKKLLEADSFHDFISSNDEMMQLPALPQYLSNLCENKNIRHSELFWEADIEKSLGYQIFKGRRRLSRDNALKIALVLKLSIDETQRLLTLSNNSRLYPFIPRDAAILYGLHHGTEYMDMQENLYDLGMTVLGDDV